MSEIVVCGGSVIGLSTAMLLARDGHHVTVLESDPAPLPARGVHAWDGWARKGVGQFHQPHNLLPRARVIFDADLPGLVATLLDAGCVWQHPLAVLPPTVEDREPRPGDDRFPFVTGRRPALEWAVATAAAGYDSIDVRRGVAAESFVFGRPVVDGAPHVVGVRTTDGAELPADLVIDAMGRRTRLPEIVVEAGGRAPLVETEDAGFVYYTRYFRGPELPAAMGPPVLAIGSFTLVTLPGDNNTWSVTLFALADDRELRAARDPANFTAVVGAVPRYAHWLDGEPITEVLATAGVVDRYRRYVVDDVPVVTGIAPVGDAWACTNPSAGRGITVGLVHAQALRDLVRDGGLDDGEKFARAWDNATEQAVAPFYRAQIAADRIRLEEMRAVRVGETPPPPDPQLASLVRAAAFDADVFRAALALRTCLALPADVLADPDIEAKVAAVDQRLGPPTPPPPALTRDELLALLAS